MKKTLLLFLCMLFLLSGCQKDEQSDGERFKEEYETLNNQKIDDVLYSTIDVNADNSIRYVDSDELLAGLENGTHVVYMGNPTCPWCRRAIPQLIETVNGYKGISIYYYNLKSAREDYENGKDSDEATLYCSIITLLKENEEVLQDCLDYYEDGTIKIPASLVLFIKGGTIIGAHRRTVESHLDPYEPLSEEQAEELQNIYKTYLDQLADYNPVYCSGC